MILNYFSVAHPYGKEESTRWLDKQSYYLSLI